MITKIYKWITIIYHCNQDDLHEKATPLFIDGSPVLVKKTKHIVLGSHNIQKGFSQSGNPKVDL